MALLLNSQRRVLDFIEVVGITGATPAYLLSKSAGRQFRLMIVNREKLIWELTGMKADR